MTRRSRDAIGEVARLEPLLDEPLSHFEMLTAGGTELVRRWRRSMSPSSRSVCSAAGTRPTWSMREVAVVTNVGRDHTDGTGDWRRAIAEEKAGIIKPNSTLVLGETAPDLRDVFLARTGRVRRAGHRLCLRGESTGGRRACDRRPYSETHL